MNSIANEFLNLGEKTITSEKKLGKIQLKGGTKVPVRLWVNVTANLKFRLRSLSISPGVSYFYSRQQNYQDTERVKRIKAIVRNCLIRNAENNHISFRVGNATTKNEIQRLIKNMKSPFRYYFG